MEPNYSLNDLLKFWHRQLKDGFKVIEAVVNLVEYKSENLPDSQKGQIILETLRMYGLFEIGYEGDRSFIEKVSTVPEPKTKPEEDIQWEHNAFEAQLELYSIRLLNTTVEFRSFMN